MPYTMNAADAYNAAMALRARGKSDDARVAFVEVKKRFSYSRFARDSELRIAEIDYASGKLALAASEWRQWAHDHRSDPAALGPVMERALTASCRAGEQSDCAALSALVTGETDCKTDNDCTVATRESCCECCVGAPKATRVDSLGKRDQMCHAVQCDVCDVNVCFPFDEPGRYRAACRAGKCSLLRK